MTPRKKAIELADKFSAQEMVLDWRTGKKCALIAVDEIIKEIKPLMLTGEKIEYWQEVRNEIEKL